MKLLLAAIVLFLIVETNAQWHKFPRQAARGSRDMLRAYRDMREANWKNSDKYFHARGNYDAAQRGPGGRWAAEVISNGRDMKFRSFMSFCPVDGREWVQQALGFAAGDSGKGDSAADQEANRWGRNGGDPNRYRPRGLPSKY